MDWVERVTGVSPDGGNGITELTLLVALVLTLATVVALVARRWRSLPPSSPRSRFWRAR
jgi:hypothetical protein